MLEGKQEISDTKLTSCLSVFDHFMLTLLLFLCVEYTRTCLFEKCFFKRSHGFSKKCFKKREIF